MQSVDTTVIEREIKISAKPETVFSFLTDPAKLRKWFVADAKTDPRPGGSYELTMADPEYVAAGKYVEVQPPTRLVFTWGWKGGDEPTPVGATTVEITLHPDGPGTLLRFVHSGFTSDTSRESHGKGWTKYLNRLAIAAAGGDPGPDEPQE